MFNIVTCRDDVSVWDDVFNIVACRDDVSSVG